MMKNFSVNLTLKGDDIFELKKIILDFLDKQAKNSILECYQPKEISMEILKNKGVVIGGMTHLNPPSKEKMDELLDLIKKAEKRSEDYKDSVKITIPLDL